MATARRQVGRPRRGRSRSAASGRDAAPSARPLAAAVRRPSRRYAASWPAGGEARSTPARPERDRRGRDALVRGRPGGRPPRAGPGGPRRAGHAAAAASIPEVADEPILFVPGVRTAGRRRARRLDGGRRDARRGVRDARRPAMLAPARRASTPAAAKPGHGLRLAGLAHEAGRGRRPGADRAEPDQPGRRAAPGRGPAHPARGQPAGRTARRARPRGGGGRGRAVSRAGWAGRRSWCGSPRWGT